MQLSTVPGTRPTIATTRSQRTASTARKSVRVQNARSVTVAVPQHAAAAAVAIPLAGEEQAVSEAVQAALACLAPHPSALEPANLVPALEAALGSLHQRPGSRTWERAVLASPLLLGLLSLSTELLEQPAAAALGPEAPLLVLEVLSYMGAGAGGPAAAGEGRQAQHCRALWRRAHASLCEAADVAGIWAVVNPEVLTPEQLVRYYEAAARSPWAGAPSKSRGMGLLLREHLQNRRFSAGDSVRLLTAWAVLRRRMPFNPDAYNYADLAASLEARAGQLSSEQLLAVAEAAPAFQWPVYRSSIPLLHAVSREAVHRSLAGGLPLPLAQRVLSSSAKGAGAMRPRLGHELEEATAEWMRTAPGLRNSSVPAPPALGGLPLAGGSPSSGGTTPQYATPLWACGAAVAAAAECGSELLQAAQPWLDATASVDLY